MGNKNDIIIALIVNREYDYIREHIMYHLSLGFDKIYIGDNNFDNDERYEELLADLIKENKVVILNYRHAPSQQIPFYNHIIKNVEYEWCAFIDCDEFLTFSENSPFKNIKDFLHSNPNILNYHVNWMCYGDNGYCYKTSNSVLSRFTVPMKKDFSYLYHFPENKHIKTILNKKSKGTFINPHSVLEDNAYNPSGKKVDRGFFSDMDYDVLYIRHFYTKSLEEWVNKKMVRHGGNNKNLNYNLERYFIYNEKTEEKLNFLNNKKYHMNTSCVITIPVYKNKLNEFEQLSLKQIVKICGKKYDLVLVCSQTLDVNYYNNIGNYNFKTQIFPDAYFKSQRSYSDLCLTPEFYERFNVYDYMLIYQLDAWIFNDNIDYFIKLDYDYYGAPHLWSGDNARVGNGGFSLRKIKSLINTCRNEVKKHFLMEDRVLCEVCKTLKICPLDVALKFSWQDNPPKALVLNNNTLPMGGHAIMRYKSFWNDYINNSIKEESIVDIKIDDGYLRQNKPQDTIRKFFE